MSDDEMKRAIELARAALRDEWAPNMRTVAQTIARAFLASQAEVEKMRAVYEAAKAWRHDRRGTHTIALMDAIDDALKSARGEGEE